MSKVFVAGGSGRVATDLIKDLVADGHEVIAGARHPEKIVELAGVTPVALDLHGDVAKIASLMAGTDAVYFVAGSRGRDLLQTDAMGAVKTMQAAERAGIKRYIMLSSMYALQPEKWADYPALAAITDYNIAKFFADNYLVHDTDLDYTIVQPATLTEEAATGKVTFGEGDDTTNPIPDVARVLATVLANDNTISKVILMRSGDTPIAAAVKEV
ncbi:NAD(P)H-binding protein [Limosilactobacillus antri]|uniref:NAD dependent epimerase/dehydratase family protein n=1 Tax=Limosilactobacillus antri DSM 16041 TaxID=525309 RepID=C8P577_9LACO|nr:NAD(P)H-binding protein [Limosilactobacillus antri]EEW54288.1 NAD dependent epimerase/dehydratase family protein [Limosilactobacillus antri DSM 16041]KRK59967.1 oxidoreductase [Limosilactobacillus antri DSM 16041]